MILNEEEMNSLKEVAQTLRPKTLDKDKLAEIMSSKDKFDIFIKGYDFIKILNITARKEKIKILLDKNEDIYDEISPLLLEYNKELSFGKEMIFDEMNKIFIDNQENVDEILLLANVLGKRVSIFDPNIHAGVLEE